MELKELQKAIECYRDASRNVSRFISMYENELSSEMRATLGNHSYYIASLIAEIQKVITKKGG